MADIEPARIDDELPAMTKLQHHQMGHAYLAAAGESLHHAADHFDAMTSAPDGVQDDRDDAPDEPARADRAFPASAATRRGFAPGSVQAATAAAMRPK